MTDEERRKMGRPREYDGNEPGAPRLTIRFRPDVLAWLRAQPGGPRRAIERWALGEMAAERKKAPPK
jgi:hypothetical protein